MLHNHKAIDQQKYTVPRSNYLWHLDEHHKLIKWGFVIHGIVDGYCHMVSLNCEYVSHPTATNQLIQITGLKVSFNNKASTVLSLFLTSIEAYGVPSCMHGDRGGENVEVLVWMIKHCGLRRASFMWGSYVKSFSCLL